MNTSCLDMVNPKYEPNCRPRQIILELHARRSDPDRPLTFARVRSPPRGPHGTLKKEQRTLSQAAGDTREERREPRQRCQRGVQRSSGMHVCGSNCGVVHVKGETSRSSSSQIAVANRQGRELSTPSGEGLYHRINQQYGKAYTLKASLVASEKRPHPQTHTTKRPSCAYRVPAHPGWKSRLGDSKDKKKCSRRPNSQPRSTGVMISLTHLHVNKQASLRPTPYALSSGTETDPTPGRTGRVSSQVSRTGLLTSSYRA